MTAPAMSSSCPEVSANNSGAGTVWMMSRTRLAFGGIALAIARVSWTRREMSGNVEDVGIHRRDGEQADERCSMTGPPDCRILADRHDVKDSAVAQEAGHGGLGQHHRVARIAEFGEHPVRRPRDTEPTGSSATAVPPATVQRCAPSRMKLLSSHRSRYETSMRWSGNQVPSPARACANASIARQRPESWAAWRASCDSPSAAVVRPRPAAMVNRGQLDGIHDSSIPDSSSPPRRCRPAARPVRPSASRWTQPWVHQRHVGHAEPVQQHGDQSPSAWLPDR